MTLQFSTRVRNAMLDQLPAQAVVKIFTGAPPANCAAANIGTMLIEFDLPVASWNAASGGAKTLASLPQLIAAIDSGITAHFRLYKSSDMLCDTQGTITMAGGGGDMIVDNSSVILGQETLITNFQLTAPGA